MSPGISVGGGGQGGHLIHSGIQYLDQIGLFLFMLDPLTAQKFGLDCPSLVPSRGPLYPMQKKCLMKDVSNFGFQCIYVMWCDTRTPLPL